MISIRPEVRNHLHACILLRERPKLHEVAANYYEQEHSYLEAAYHWREASEFEKAAQILIEEYQAIIDDGQIGELQELLLEFHVHSLTPTTWAQLKIVSGDVSTILKDLDTSLTEYGYVLGTDGATIDQRALAYSRRARSYELLNRWRECFFHYQKGIDLLKAEETNNELLVDIYIDRAWIYIQERPDLDKAEADLKEAERWLPKKDSRRRALFHNAWIEFYWKKQDKEKGFHHCFEAWVAATEAQDKSLMVMTGHNLGHEYIWREEHEIGLDYLQKTLKLAKEIGDRQHEAKCYRAIAASYVLQGEEAEPDSGKAKFATAISYLNQAEPLFLELHNVNWVGHVYHDLANAYAGVGDVVSGRQNYQKALDIAHNRSKLGGLTELEQEGLLADLAQAVDYYPELATELDDNQQLALTTIRIEGELTSRRYRKLTGVARGTASIHLNKLVELGYLEKEGDGRSTRYLLKQAESTT
ncbi:MAG: helix-turn-helix domain-containing protein [Chloroflexota bacterium]